MPRNRDKQVIVYRTVETVASADRIVETRGKNIHYILYHLPTLHGQVLSTFKSFREERYKGEKKVIVYRAVKTVNSRVS